MLILFDPNGVKSSGGTEKAFSSLSNVLKGQLITSVEELPKRCDVLITQHAFAFERCEAKKKIWWSHHFADQPITQQNAVWARVHKASVVTLCKSHAYNFVNVLNIHSAIIPHGVDVIDFEPSQTVSNRLVYAAAPFRGLEKLLEWWPAVHELAPKKELHVYGGGAVYGLPENHQAIYDKAANLPNVFLHGAVERSILLSAYRGATYVHPSIWAETYGLAADEALASGANVVVSNLAALGERFSNAIAVDDSAAWIETLAGLRPLRKQANFLRTWEQVANDWNEVINVK